ncbi:MAG: hypothetical protein JOZ73_04935, partial [Solirubrobacterales bacterium]|nr:hypothetical protein [Solirubrobacterales bacterium]
MGARKHLRLLLPLLVLAAFAVAAIAAKKHTKHRVGRIGPALKITGNGRHLLPPGRLVKLGHFPTGGAVTPDGRFYWTVSTGRALNDVRIVTLKRKRPRVVQVLGLPGASGGIAIDGAHRLVYVSGVADSPNADERRPNLPGGKGDVIHVFSY